MAIFRDQKVCWEGQWGKTVTVVTSVSDPLKEDTCVSQSYQVLVGKGVGLLRVPILSLSKLSSLDIFWLSVHFT